VAGKKKFHNRNNSRHKREESPVTNVSTETAAASAEGSVLRDVAEDELEQVELIMEDISDEISDLEVNLIVFFFTFLLFSVFHLNFVFRL
jgi:hypothetical protein